MVSSVDAGGEAPIEWDLVLWSSMAPSAAVAGLAAPHLSPADRQELALIARCVEGDVEAFRPLVLRYQRVTYAVALRILGARADAEDAVQQAFTDAFRALDRFDGRRREHAFSTWLLRILVNRCKDVRKSKKWTEERLSHDEFTGDEAAFAHVPRCPEATLAASESRRRIEAGLAAVPAKYRTALVLKDIEDLSYEQMAEVLRLPVTTLKIRVVRARTMLRARLERQERA